MKRLFALMLALLTLSASAAGFHVSGSKLLDPSNQPMTLRGVDLVHWDQIPANMGQTHANVARFNIDFTQPAAANLAHVQTVAMANNMVPIVGNWLGTCDATAAKLASIVDTWVAKRADYAWLDAAGIVNIANEWGPATVDWRDSYVTAVQRMRAAGYSGALMVDAGNCGQGAATIVQWGKDVLAADPLHNVLFDVHVYSAWHFPATASWMQDYATSMAQLKATGLAIVVGEFGPVGIGPSPTQVPIDRIVSDAEANGFGWLAWAGDDNDLASVRSDDKWFGMFYDTWDRSGLGWPNNFTVWGRAVVTKLTALNTPPVAPVYASPTSLWCLAGPACAIPLTVTSPIGAKVTMTLVGNDPRITVNSTTTNLAWWSSPAIGTYPMTLVLTDAKGNVTQQPITLTVGWTKPAGI